MTPLKEVRTIHACPKVGDTSVATLTKTNSFLTGADGVQSIELDGAVVTVRGARKVIGVPVAACQWVEYMPAPVVTVPPVATTVRADQAKPGPVKGRK